MPEIPGWFDFYTLYSEMANSAPPGSTIVEVGCYHGKSLIALGRLCGAVGVNVIGVDHCRGSGEHSEEMKKLADGNLAGPLVKNLIDEGVIDNVTLIVAKSVKAAEMFADRSLWGVFIDADHGTESVKADIAAWGRKVMPGGWLCGHDVGWSTVKEAIDEVLPGYEVRNTCWVMRV